MKHFKKQLSLIFFLCCFITSAFAFEKTTGQFSVTPGHVDIDLSNPTATTLYIHNTGHVPIELNIRPRQYSLESLQIGKLLNPSSPMEGNLTPYLIISPRLITVQPEQTRQIRVSSRIPENLKEGSYYTHIAIYPSEKPPSLSPKVRGQEFGTRLDIKMAIAIAVHAYYGKGEPSLTARCTVSPDRHLTIYFTNATPWMFSGLMEIHQLLKDGRNQLVTQMSLFVQRQSERTLNLTKIMPREGMIKISWKNETSKITQETTCSNIPTKQAT